ncbi:MAG: tRNA lysidine(34) synthetase TilS [Rhodospirillaceae bacterium]
MASSRKPKRADRADWDLLPRVSAQLAELVPPNSSVLVGLSGGIDSIVLLDLLKRFAARKRLRLCALHVNHQLQVHAADWVKFCRRLCRQQGVPLRVVKVEVERRNSVERAARDARYDALLKQRTDFVALAHNQDDQAETLLLHLLRGAGIRGLAGMRVVAEPPVRAIRPSSVRVLRPLLDVPRSAITRYAEQRKLEWIEDPSNASPDFTRNFLRGEILPLLAGRFPAYRQALSRAACHAAEAADLLDALACMDAVDADRETLAIASLRALPAARAKNALRYFLFRHGVEIPSAERLEEALRQVLDARSDAQVRIDFGERQLRVHRGVLALVPRVSSARHVEKVWRGEVQLDVPELGGTLRMRKSRGSGLSAARLHACTVTIRGRSGGERLRVHAAGATRTVKNLMQEARMPTWERDRLPFIYCGDELVCVPGLAIASAYRAAPSEPSIEPVWHTR